MFRIERFNVLIEIAKRILKFLIPTELRVNLRRTYRQFSVNNKKRKVLSKILSLKSLKSKNSPQYIVSLTSYGKRLYDTAPYTITTLFNQTIQPDRIILWISEDDRKNIGKNLQKLVKKGLEIRCGENLRSYKKLIPAIREFPDDYIITADDDLYYPEDWFKQLIAQHKKYPNKIICHRAHGIKVDSCNNPISYNDWDYCIEPKIYLENTKHSPFSVFPTGGAGTLYPPHCLYKDVTNVDLFIKLAPHADDIWFWAMAVINKDESPYILIENGYSKNLQDVEPEQQINGNALNNYNVVEKGNDKQLKAVIEYFPQLNEVLKKIIPIKENILVSVIVPVYNASQWLERTFNSIVKQTYCNDKIDVIFVDDCSTDNSVEILENLFKNYNGQIKFNLIKHTEKEQGFARNTGIKNSQGDYVYLMDADDEISENCILLLAELAQKYENVDVVQGNTLRIEAIKDGNPVVNPTWDISKYGFPEFVKDELWIKERLGMWIRKDGYIPHSTCNKLIRKKFITDNNLYITKTQAGEDQMWNFFVSKKIQSIAFCNSYTYIYHREHTSVVSQTSDREKAIIPQLELCGTILLNLDWEVAYLQIILVKGLLNIIKDDLDANLNLYRKYFPKFQQINGIINNGFSDIMKRKKSILSI